MPSYQVDYFSPVRAYAEGQQVAQQRRRNALAEQVQQEELAQAPVRNRLRELQVAQAENQIDREDSEGDYRRFQQLLTAPNVKEHIARFEPDMIEDLAEDGIDFNTADDASLRAHLEGYARQMAGEAGIAPAVKMETIQTDDGAVLQRDPTTGTLKEVMGRDQSLDRLLMQDELARRRDADTRSFTAAENEKNRAAQLERAKTTAGGKQQKITDGERTAANYLHRMRQAEPLIGTYKPSTKDAVAFSRVLNSDGDITSAVANQFLSPEGQKFYQASSDWVRAKLRKESGAAIPAQEMLQEIKTYFPMPGDSDAVVKQKAAARKSAEEGMLIMAGSAAGKAAAPEITATGPNGQKIVLRNGQWVPLGQ